MSWWLEIRKGSEQKRRATRVRLQHDLHGARNSLNAMSGRESPPHSGQGSYPARDNQAANANPERKYGSTDRVADSGNKIGRKLAIQYIQAVKSSDGQLTMDELLSDLDKDLNETFINNELGLQELHSFNLLMSRDLLFTKLRDSAIEGFFEFVSRWEKGASSSLPGSIASLPNAKFAIPSPPTKMHLTPTEFEQYCVEWAIYLGYKDAAVTRAVKDGGIDISSRSMVAQCKYQELPVGVKPIRELFGLSQAQRKKPIFFSLNGYSREAINEAEQFNMELWSALAATSKSPTNSWTSPN